LKVLEHPSQPLDILTTLTTLDILTTLTTLDILTILTTLDILTILTTLTTLDILTILTTLTTLDILTTLTTLDILTILTMTMWIATVMKLNNARCVMLVFLALKIQWVLDVHPALNVHLACHISNVLPNVILCPQNVNNAPHVWVA